MAPLFPLYQVDAFAEAPFRGNPAGVCFLMGHKPDTWMQRIAQEMNLSETAFFMQAENGFHLRWFTPTTEVDLCGHATLATAHIVWQSDLVGADEDIRFQTRSGTLTAKRSGDWIELDFPAQAAHPAPLPEGLVAALGAKPITCLRSKSDYLLPFASEAEVKAIRPDFRALAKVDARGIIVTAPADGAATDFVSRFFGPAVGVDEDPVTGSAHCTLGPYWSKIMAKNLLTGYQASERGGIVEVEMLAEERIALRGKAVTVFQGVITQEGITPT